MNFIRSACYGQALIGIVFLTGLSQVTAQTTPLQPFRNLTLTGAFVVSLTKGEQPGYRVEGPVVRTQQLQVRQQAAQLQIEDNTRTERDAEPLRLYVTCPNLEQIRLEGNFREVMLTGFANTAVAVVVPEESQVAMQGDVNRLSINTEHGSRLQLTGMLRETTVRATYGSKVQLRGTGDNLTADLFEGGQCDAFGFRCKQVNIQARAASQASVNVSETLTVFADQRSTVRAKGDVNALRKFYTTDKPLLRFGYDALRGNDLAEATYYFRLATTLFSQSWRSFEGLSAVYKAQNRPDSAQLMLAKAQQLNPQAYATATTYLKQGYRRATVVRARNTRDEVIASCQDYTLLIDAIGLPVCVGNNLPDTYRKDGQDIWVKCEETKAGKLRDRGYEVVMNDCCGLIVRLQDVQSRAE